MRQACKRMRGGLIVLLALWVVSCTGSPTSPTDIRTPVLSLSSRSSALDAGVGTRACTLGAGFWKTHPHAWPSRFDPNATFYASGKSWIDVLRTPPSGDSYYILGHQFIAAGLNLNGSIPTYGRRRLERPTRWREDTLPMGLIRVSRGPSSPTWRSSLKTLMKGSAECRRVAEARAPAMTATILAPSSARISLMSMSATRRTC
jgi:hypothetical protein